MGREQDADKRLESITTLRTKREPSWDWNGQLLSLPVAPEPSTGDLAAKRFTPLAPLPHAAVEGSRAGRSSVGSLGEKEVVVHVV